MDILTLLERCVGLEQGAATVYETLAARCASDPELVELWSAMARDEREHARKLSTWRDLLACEPADHRPQASGFAAGVEAVEALLADARARASRADEEQAFALALSLEASEIDAIYTTLLQASPLARFPDFAVTVRHETSRHHEALRAAAECRCRSEENRLRIALLAAHHD
jgi:rubrerythrin